MHLPFSSPAAPAASASATALLFRKAGYLTVATARDPATLARLAARGCETLPLDVTDEASRQAAVAESSGGTAPSVC